MGTCRTPMLPAQLQQQLIDRYRLIEDPQERLAAVMSTGKKLPPLTEAERTEENRVQGCVSRVWVVGEVHEGRCRFRVDADSALVKGLAGFLCEIYQGASPAEVAAFEPTLLETLHLTDHLSPTRRQGLQQVWRTLREFAESG